MTKEITSYSLLSPISWWKLRKKFNSSIPKSEINKSYLATALDISEASAGTNILPKLKLIGLVDEAGKVTELAIKWRNNDEYKSVCDELISTLYPSELIDAIDNPLLNKDKVVRWFQGRAKVGEDAAKKMATFYLLLVEGDYTKQDDALQSKTDKPKKAKIYQSKHIRKTYLLLLLNLPVHLTLLFTLIFKYTFLLILPLTK
jgi:hypothetical protein